MKILVVGGTGALGGHAAIHLASRGHDVSIGGRNPANPATPMAAMPFVQGDYVAGDYTPEKLAGFDWVVFAAGNDPRHVPQGVDFAEFLIRANHEAVPAFFAASALFWLATAKASCASRLIWYFCARFSAVCPIW